ncbi:hypothetical protein LWI29_034118 [Acer saccharum]|uniref:Uncharacterized protein n=1 Tax=Acer saccharum TaxID=4024 RepID=A0AA39S245_ACESA|nr:hypothetical protein LWI29_034118 [Acer saccharum]
MNMKNITHDNGSGSTSVPFRFNVQAPEFVPRSHSTLPVPAQVPISGYYYPCFHYLGGAATTGVGSTDWFFVGDQADQPLYVISNPNVAMPNSSKNLLTDDLRLKIVKQVEKLNDERNWRKGLRVRLLLRCSPKSVLKNRKSEFDGILDDDDAESGEDSSHPNSHPELVGENTGEENSMGSKKGWAGRGRGKGRGGRAAQSHSGRGLLLAPSPQSSNAATQSESASSGTKQTSKGPRMPDGTRGFTMGRGKPLNSPALGNSP